MSSSLSLPILVAGGGFGGVAAALVRQDFDVKVLEQTAQLGEIGAGIQLYQRSRVARTARVVLSARAMGRIFHAKAWRGWCAKSCGAAARPNASTTRCNGCPADASRIA